jgi:hypothetical protein
LRLWANARHVAARQIFFLSFLSPHNKSQLECTFELPTEKTVFFLLLLQIAGLADAEANFVLF